MITTPLLRHDASRFEKLAGWTASTRGARSFADLPAAAVKYVKRLEELVEAPVALLSTSPDREDTMPAREPFAGYAAGGGHSHVPDAGLVSGSGRYVQRRARHRPRFTLSSPAAAILGPCRDSPAGRTSFRNGAPTALAAPGHVGRPPRLTPDQLDHARSLIASGKGKGTVAALLGVHVSTLRRALRTP